MRRHLIAQLFDCFDGSIGVFPGNEVFRLQLFSAAGSEPHFKMRQTLMPGTGDSHLRRTVFRRNIPDGVQVLRSGGGAKELVLPAEGSALPYPALDPYLADIPFQPVSEQADAIPRRHDLFEMMLQLLYGQVLVHILTHLVSRLNGKGHLGNNTQTTEIDDCAGKQLAVLLPGEAEG